MATVNLTVDGGAPFRIKRPIITTSGVSADVDPTVDAHFDELARLLGKRIFGNRATALDALTKEVNALITPTLTPKFEPPKDPAAAPAPTSKHHAAAHHGAQATTHPANPANANVQAAAAPIEWAPGSLGATLDDAAATDLTLADYIDMVPELSDLKYAYENSLSGNWSLMDANVRFALNTYPAIRDYLLVYAANVMKVTEFNGLKNFILNNSHGVATIINYAAVSAARSYILSQALKVDGYNDDGSDFMTQVVNAKLSLTEAAFIPALKKVIDDFVFNGKQLLTLQKAKIKIPDNLKPQIIQFMKKSAVPVDDTNIDFFLPTYLSQLSGGTTVDDSATSDPDVADQDFDVEFLQDTDAVMQVSRSAVRCAAQLYYSMVLGDELDVFSTINYFTHNYLLRGGIEIQDSTLRDDLQLYVFSNKFTDLKSRKINDRTRPAERAMFYKQAFNAGAEITDNDLAQILVPNPEFPKLWKVLILETAKYIQQAQAAFYPDQYVSRQNVQQAVEDLQYNLSTHCIGMVNVVSPLIYAELDFVIRRIFMHDEVMRQIVPAGGTWWRVVETLYLAMKNARPRSTVLYNKAKLGYDILKDIGDYDPASFENNDTFSNFISEVQAFITTQSILQQDDDADGSGAPDSSDPAQAALS